MAGVLEGLLAKVQGKDLEAEEAQKKKASEGIQKYEQETGEKFKEEPGIEPDYTIEDAASMAIGGPAAGMGKKIASYAVRQGEKAVAKSALDKLRDEGKPMFSEAVSAGKTEAGPSAFSKFIRGEGAQVAGEAEKAAAQPKQVLNQPRFGTSDKVKVLQDERQSLNLNTPEGRGRLKEIDDLLKNRTYFKE